MIHAPEAEALDEKPSWCNEMKNSDDSTGQLHVAPFSPFHSFTIAQGPHYLHERNFDYQAVEVEPKATDGILKAFPKTLHQMLRAAEHNGFQEIVSWQPHGYAFRVHDKKKFVKQIMPTYFRHSKFTSFQRQLNLYCFRRLTTGIDNGAYYHELFRRDQPLLSKDMVRKRIKGNGPRAAADPESEPDFGSLQSSELVVQPTVIDHASAAVGWGSNEDTLIQRSLNNLQLPSSKKDCSFFSSNNAISAHGVPSMKHNVPLVGDEMRMHASSGAQFSRSEAFIRSSRLIYQDSFSRHNKSYFQANLGSRSEPSPQFFLVSANKPLDDTCKQSFRCSRKFAFKNSQYDTEHRFKNTTDSSSGNEHRLLFEDNDQEHFDVEPKLNHLKEAHQRLIDDQSSNDNSLCDFQDEDIVSLCSSDWKF